MNKVIVSLLATCFVALFGGYAYASAASAPAPVQPIAVASSTQAISGSTTLYVLTNAQDQDTCYVVVSSSSIIPSNSISCVKTSTPAPSSASLHG